MPEISVPAGADAMPALVLRDPSQHDVGSFWAARKLALAKLVHRFVAHAISEWSEPTLNPFGLKQARQG